MNCKFLSLCLFVCSSLLAEPAFHLVILGKDEPLLDADELAMVDGVWLINHEFPGDETPLLNQLQATLSERPLQCRTIDYLTGLITTYYDEQGYPLVLAYAPDQELSQGVLQIQIIEGELGKLSVEGNKWTKAKRLKRYVGLKSGDPINEHDLFCALYFINRNPFRQVDLIYSPGQEEYTTDITLAVRDRRPVRFYAGTDNTGVPPTNRTRWFAGFNWGNALGLDQILSYQYTASYDIHRFQAHTLQYIIPFPWKHRLNMYGGYNEVEPKIPVTIMRNTGWGLQASLRYEMPFMIRRFLEQEWDIGFDFKRTNNTFTFSDEQPTIGKNVNLTQFVFSYSGIYERNRHRLDFEADFYYSPFEWLPDQTPSDYQSLRTGAEPKWIYFRGAFNYLQRIGTFSLACTARGQGSSTALLPSEQFGLGGYDTIRGYDERAVNKDNAVVLNIELRSPPISFFHASARRPSSDAFQVLAFFDGGWGIDHTRNGSNPLSEYLLGVGPGLRYTFDPYITARLDLGFKLHTNQVIGTSQAKLHFALTMSY